MTFLEPTESKLPAGLPAGLREPGIYVVTECPTYDFTDSDWALKCGGTSIAIEEVIAFDGGSDEMSITVDNKGKKFCDKLRICDRVEFEFLNPAVNGGAPFKHRGIIVHRTSHGSTIQITSSSPQLRLIATT